MKTIRRYFSEDGRSKKIRNNVMASALLKGLDIMIYLLLVPLTLGYLNAYEYGIWLTLNSILLWVNSFDIGLGNGLRNKLAVAIAQNDWKLGQMYVSTTFYTLIFIMLIVFGVVYLFSSFVNWYNILNVNIEFVSHLDEVVIISLACFCLCFVFKFIGNIYLALQFPAINNLLIVLGHAISLLLISLLTKTTNGSLLYVAIAYSISPVVVYIIAFPITFIRIYRNLFPSIRLVRFSFLRDLMGIGVQFFFLQVAGIILFASSNIIISKILGPDSVTPYNIVYRYFSIIPLAFTILITPMWSAVTDAYTRGDIEWIRKSMHNIRYFLLGIAVVVIIMISFSNIVYHLWVGNGIVIPFRLTLFMGIYVYILVWSLSYSNFLNGIGKLRVQVINTSVIAIVFYPLSFLLIDIYGVEGIVQALLLVNLSGAVFNTIQFNKIVSKKDKGIWSK